MNALSLHPKVAAPLLANYLAVLIVFSLHQWAGVELPDTVLVALAGLLALVTGWAAPNLVAPDASK